MIIYWWGCGTSINWSDRVQSGFDFDIIGGNETVSVLSFAGVSLHNWTHEELCTSLERLRSANHNTGSTLKGGEERVN